MNLKPNNPNSINRGYSQLDRYIKAADEQFGPGFTGVIETYNKP